jgi:hypothetical protein
MPGPFKIACGYREGALPADWFQVVRRLRHQIERARLDVRITLIPLGAVPADAHLLVVPAAFADEARRVVAKGKVLAMPVDRAEQVLAGLVDRLRREAPPRPADSGRSARTIVRRGSEVVPWNAG